MMQEVKKKGLILVAFRFMLAFVGAFLLIGAIVSAMSDRMSETFGRSKGVTPHLTGRSKRVKLC